MELRGRTVLVTGATGFVGGRLAEKLALEQGVTVRALVRDFHTATWLSRLPVEMIYGDLADGAAVEQALAGCSVLFHCAASNSPDDQEAQEVNVAGTRRLLEAALRHRVARVVHVSSVAVHQRPQDGRPIDERTPFVGAEADAYARTKLAGEQVALALAGQGLPVVVVRPTVIYGPRARWWTVGYAQRIRKDRLALPRGIRGCANLLYVDDLIEALLLAATAAGVEGEVVIAGAESSTSWPEFIGHYAAMNGKPLALWPGWLVHALALTFDRLDAWILPMQRRPAAWNRPVCFGLRAVRFALKPYRRCEWWELQMYDREERFDTSKARELLGFRPRFSLEQGMAATREWLQAQAYLDDGTEWPAG